MEAVQELLEEIAENQDGFVATNRVYNKPTLISISSADREPDAVNQTPYSQVAFSSFSVNLPRPALDVDSIQLMSSNIPMCNNNIPDNAAVFWYYRTSLYSGVVPNSNNLFMNRLLPSYYKPELVNQAATLAFNKTFQNYAALSTEMAKASANDLALYNWETLARPALEGEALEDVNVYIPFRPNDMLVAYNPTYNKFQGTGLTTEPAVNIWSGGTTYALGDIVQTPLVYAPYNPATTYSIGQYVISPNFVLYRSLVNGNVGVPLYTTANWKNIGDLLFWNRPQTYVSLQAANLNHTPSSSPTFWKRIGAEVIAAWSSTTAYDTGRYVSYDNDIYISTADTFNEVPDGGVGWEITTTTKWYRYLITGPQDREIVPAQAGVDPFVVDTFPKLLWNQYALYEVGDRVEYEGQLWRCLAQNRNATPQQVDTIWSSGATFYNAGTILRYNGIIYRAITVVPQGLQPDTYPAYWKVVGYWGWDDCEWNSTITYNRDDNVIYEGTTYRLAVNSSLNQTPSPSSAVWDVIDPDKFSSPAYGLFTVSSTLDFVEQIVIDGSIRLPFPVGIQPQPFNPRPRRLLNTITGFTFNGIFNADAFSNILRTEEQRTILSQQTAQFNRLRPIPEYDEALTVGLGALRDPVATATYTYTADGYCNLVYSSIISTYCDVVGPSSIDTQRTSNLLAVNSMNCGNLGISFYAPYLDNPLTKVQNDIYNIYVEFRDEFGDLYYFTNNAVVTITFKMTYKK